MIRIMGPLLLTWGALVLEFSRPDLLPHGAILFPIVAAGMLWSQSAGGLFLWGTVLVVDWILRPNALPVVPAGLTLLAMLLLTARMHNSLWSQRRSLLRRLAGWPGVPGLAVVAVGLSLAPALFTRQLSVESAVPMLQQYGLVTLPLSLLLAGLLKLADEFGLRAAGHSHSGI